jgi:hypothetical protein
VAEKKNLVIKVKYPTHAPAAELPAPKIVTVWHVKRIAWVAGVLVGLIILLCYGLGGSDSKTGVGPVVNAPPKPTVGGAPAASPPAPVDANKKNQPTIKKSPDDVSKEPMRVRRALLVTAITDKEPRGEIAQTLRIRKATSLTLYYFTELRGMNGKTVYHEWLQDGVSVTKQALPVAADRWRISTQHTFDDQAAGNWAVKLIDEKGKVLHTKNFTVSITS